MANSERIIVTGSSQFTDIDSFACAIGLSELHNLQGINSLAILKGPLNYSVTETVRGWNLQYYTTFASTVYNDFFVIVDVSDPEVLPDFVDLNKVIEIYDHHHGFEEYWFNKLAIRSHIESVGACATLIWEQFKEKELTDRISKNSARILQTAIISNTLHFQAKASTDRDHEAVNDLSRLSFLPSNWSEIYFNECQKWITNDLRSSIINDTKPTKLAKLNDTVAIGQLELWNASKLIEENTDTIVNTLEGFGFQKWFITIPSISEGKSYFYCTDNAIKNLLSQVLGASFDGNVGKLDFLILRKEIIKAIDQSL